MAREYVVKVEIYNAVRTTPYSKKSLGNQYSRRKDLKYGYEGNSSVARELDKIMREGNREAQAERVQKALTKTTPPASPVLLTLEFLVRKS